MALVYRTSSELRLPLTRSLSDFRNQTFCPFARQRRAPIRFLFSDILFSEKRCAGDHWPSGDRAAELAGRWQQHPARTSAVTALVVALRPGFARRQAALKDQEKWLWFTALPRNRGSR